jgi:hypothetical protein
MILILTESLKLKLFNDTRDDWILDRFRFLDLLKTDKFNLELFNLAVLTPPGGILNPPKNILLARQTESPSLTTRLMFMSCCEDILEDYEKLFPKNNVYSNLVDSSTKYSEFLFKNYFNEWKAFESNTRIKLEKYSLYVIYSDLANFYASIQPHQLLGCLKSYGLEGNALKNIEHAFSKLDYSKTLGLPQNNETSAFFSNLFLFQIDKNLLAKDYQFLRYVDDIRFFCTTKKEMSSTMLAFSNELRKINLYINNSKTRYYKIEEMDPVKLESLYTNFELFDKVQEMLNSFDFDRYVKAKDYVLNYLRSKTVDEYDKKIIKFILGRLNFIMTKIDLGLDEKILEALATYCLEIEPSLAIDLVKFLNSYDDIEFLYSKLSIAATNSPFYYVKYLISYFFLLKRYFGEDNQTLYFEVVEIINTEFTDEENLLETELIWACWIVLLKYKGIKHSKVKSRKLKLFHSRRLIFTFSELFTAEEVKGFMELNDWERERFQVASVQHLLDSVPNAIRGIEKFGYNTNAHVESYI